MSADNKKQKSKAKTSAGNQKSGDKPSAGQKRAAEKSKPRPDSAPADPSAPRSAEQEKSNLKLFLTDNAVILVLILVALLVAIIGWQVEGGCSDAPEERADSGRQGVSIEQTTGFREGWYYVEGGRFRLGEEVEISESPGIINVQQGATSGIITMENIELQDDLRDIAAQSGGELVGSAAVIFPTAEETSRAVLLLGVKRFDLYFQGPESQKIVTAIIDSAERQ